MNDIEDTPNGDEESMNLKLYPETPRIEKDRSRTISESPSPSKSHTPYVPPSSHKRNLNKLMDTDQRKIGTRSAIKEAANPTSTAHQIGSSPNRNAGGIKYKINHNDRGGKLTIFNGKNGFYNSIFVMDHNQDIVEYVPRDSWQKEQELFANFGKKLDKLPDKIVKKIGSTSDKKGNKNNNNNTNSNYVDINKSPRRLFKNSTAKLSIESRYRTQRAVYCGKLIAMNLGHDPDAVGRCFVEAVDNRASAEYILDHCKPIKVVSRQRFDNEIKELRECGRWCYLQASQLADEGISFRGNDRMRTGEKDRTYDTDGMITHILFILILYIVLMLMVPEDDHILFLLILYIVLMLNYIQDQWPYDHSLNQMHFPVIQHASNQVILKRGWNICMDINHIVPNPNFGATRERMVHILFVHIKAYPVMLNIWYILQ